MLPFCVTHTICYTLQLIAIYEEADEEPFEGTLKKFLSDFQEVSLAEDKFSSSNSDASSNYAPHHQQAQQYFQQVEKKSLYVD